MDRDRVGPAAEAAGGPAGGTHHYSDFYELMRFRVSKILLVSSPYDAFILEEDGMFSELSSGHYEDMALTAPPRINRVSTPEDALSELSRSRYDLVITMSRLGEMDPYHFGRLVKDIQPNIAVVLLLTDAGDIALFHRPGRHDGIEKVFFWNGDPSLFMAITKYIEDMVNVERDVTTDLVRTILVVEDSPRFYSAFLPIIYSEVMRQNRLLITEGLNEHEKLLRKRTRPKLLLVETYEEALDSYNRFRDSILCVISDISFPRGGADEDDIGFTLASEVRGHCPILLQSSQTEHGKRAAKENIPFLDKSSPELLSGLSDFFKTYLGFGDFIFELPDGKEIGRAKDINEFIDLVQRMPTESLVHHGTANQFSNWLLARGEVDLALRLRPKKVSDFTDGEEMRKYLLESILEMRKARQLGVILDFSQQNFEFDGTFTKLGKGSLGGKGRGIAFLSSLLKRSSLDGRFKGMGVSIPDTLVIATDWFDMFLEGNDLRSGLERCKEDAEVSRLFLGSKLPSELERMLWRFLSIARYPLAVRSSSLLEDSLNQPFAGIYSTIMLPNASGDAQERLDDLENAIKLVYASTFHRAARSYRGATVHIKEEEKMAVVVQRLVGTRKGDLFHPLFSGVAQSLNFYPMDPLTREEGVAIVAYGLGKIVMERQSVLSFSPCHPGILLGMFGPDDIIRRSQRDLYTLDMGSRFDPAIAREDATLSLRSVSDIKDQECLEHLVSTYDPDDGILRDGGGRSGPRYITFSGILKHGTMPLPEVLKEVLDMGRKGMGRPVEMEFACSLDRNGAPTLYLLQVRPLVTLKHATTTTLSEEDVSSALIVSDMAQGDGVFELPGDLLVITPELFDNMMTNEIAKEIGSFNGRSSEGGYVLMGPGRWGTRDRFLGIPVKWDQISSAKALVEYSTEGFRVDPSQGTHFFHNITALGIPYLTVRYGNGPSRVDWASLLGLPEVGRGKYILHLRAPGGLSIKIDGKKGTGIMIAR
ncbi:MAG: hypothetical protein MUC62_01445 [Candidatus Thermoplasmatota archaeon]|jgi:hypothetical protein|nr:hypothetical protein [Candidatus Thermoplasmatota archaeon]